jgi:hypothetical protein
MHEVNHYNLFVLYQVNIPLLEQHLFIGNSLVSCNDLFEKQEYS